MPDLPVNLGSWLSAAAERLDTEVEGAGAVLPSLAEAGLFRIGVARHDGGDGRDVVDAVDAIAAVSEHSLAAGFVFWGHRSFIEYLLQSPNSGIREELLPGLIAGRTAGATGLSNAMKFLAGIEELQIKAGEAGDGHVVVNGRLPWVTNLRPQGFHVAAAVEGAGNNPAFVAALSSGDAGILRSPDLELMAMRATNTAALDIRDVQIGRDRILHANASEWLPQIRPAFLGLQCGMSIGLARRALREVESKLEGGRSVLAAPHDALSGQLREQERLLRDGLRGNRFAEKPTELFHIRIRLADIAVQAVQLELQVSGGKAYLSKPGQDFQRRYREVAFLPVITPSLVQLKTALQAHEQARRVSEVA